MSARDELAQAFRRTEALSVPLADRKGWTKKQWADDAERIMAHIDGSASALVNGHILGLISRIRELTPRTITTAEERALLAPGTIGVDEDGNAWKRGHGSWVSTGGDSPVLYDDVDLTLTILREASGE